MLVLSRQRDESIVINDNITVTVVDIRGDRVRLGIEAPKEIPIHRQEVYDTIQRDRASDQPDQDQSTDSSSRGGDPNYHNEYKLQQVVAGSQYGDVALGYDPLSDMESSMISKRTLVGRTFG